MSFEFLCNGDKWVDIWWFSFVFCFVLFIIECICINVFVRVLVGFLFNWGFNLFLLMIIGEFVWLIMLVFIGIGNNE